MVIVVEHNLPGQDAHLSHDDVTGLSEESAPLQPVLRAPLGVVAEASGQGGRLLRPDRSHWGREARKRRSQMTTVSTPTHVGSRRRSLLVLATAITAGIMAVPVANAADTGSQKSLPTKATAASLASLSSGYTAYVNAVIRERSSRAAALASLSRSARAYVEAIMAMTPAARAATFGTGKLFTQTSGDSVLGSLSPASQRYVKAIMALTPDQLAAGAGGGW
jgi:hypothetical protein